MASSTALPRDKILFLLYERADGFRISTILTSARPPYIPRARRRLRTRTRIKASTLGDPANGHAELITGGNDAGKVLYTPDADYSNDAQSLDEFTYEACDDIAPTECDSATVGVKVDPTNDAPVLSGIEGVALGYSEGDAPKAITSAITVSDADGANLSGATVSISAGYQNGQDVLAFAGQNGIGGSWSAGAGTLTLTGSASPADYQAALRSVTYENTSDDPSTAARTVSFKVDDGQALSDAATRDINVTP